MQNNRYRRLLADYEAEIRLLMYQVNPNSVDKSVTINHNKSILIANQCRQNIKGTRLFLCHV